jgi:xanthine dehydrogenase accessory factor
VSAEAAPPRRVLVLGIGDVGSAVAHRLSRAGHRVVIADGPAPTTTRRGMSFADAIFDGTASLAGLTARRVDRAEIAGAAAAASGAIPICIATPDQALAAGNWDVLVDARMRKRDEPPVWCGRAALTIGLGPGFVAGVHVDRAIETSWGPHLGTVLRAGPTQALAGEPNPIDGHGRGRFVYAPAAGPFRTALAIGDKVDAGAPVAQVAGAVLVAPISGVLRGLTRDGVPVFAGTKVIEVDPRGDPTRVLGLGERPARIATGVLDALSAGTMSPVA